MTEADYGHSRSMDKRLRAQGRAQLKEIKTIELRFIDCGHVIKIENTLHNADHDHCFVCHPELADNPIPGRCPSCRVHA
jgi:rubrerythrin